MAYSIGLDLPGAGEIMRMIMSLQSPGKVDGSALDFPTDTQSSCILTIYNKVVGYKTIYME